MLSILIVLVLGLGLMRPAREHADPTAGFRDPVR